MADKNIVVILSYDFIGNNGYPKIETAHSLVETREKAVEWARKKMDEIAGGYNGANHKNYRVSIGELQEEYKAERTWAFTPTKIAPKVAEKQLTHAATPGVEI